MSVPTSRDASSEPSPEHRAASAETHANPSAKCGDVAARDWSEDLDAGAGPHESAFDPPKRGRAAGFGPPGTLGGPAAVAYGQNGGSPRDALGEGAADGAEGRSADLPRNGVLRGVSDEARGRNGVLPGGARGREGVWRGATYDSARGFAAGAGPPEGDEDVGEEVGEGEGEEGGMPGIRPMRPSLAAKATTEEQVCTLCMGMKTREEYQVF